MSRTRQARRDERVLVTGAAGFIGRHLVRRLQADGATVTALTRATVDLTDRRALHAVVSAAHPDVVVHVAAARALRTSTERAATVTVNTKSGAWVVEAIPNTCRVVVRLGSSTEYAPSTGPMNELTPVRPTSFFGATKAAGSVLLTAAATERGIASRVLRAFQVFGPDDKPDRFVPTVMAAARSGAEVPLTRPGLRRDWVWVDDVVEACLLAADAEHLPAGTTHNIGTGVQTTNEGLVACAERVTGHRIMTRPGAHPGRQWDTEHWVCDPRAAHTELRWAPRVDLAEGLARCWVAAR